ncbi:MAG TPA: cation-transporting P-type ATPase, partial [Steroidobacteraceae bacterium]|nr:cation-transporting P-type ATPase [Steroidobacteraceae bacterium]
MKFEAPAREAFWRLTLQHLLQQLDATPGGMTASEAEARLARCGPNKLNTEHARSLARRIIGRLVNPLVLVLLFAACVSAFTGDMASFLIVISVVFMSIALDSVQEQRAEKAVERLRASVALTERVLRDGREVEIPAEDLVPGDVVLLAAGDLVPADG